MGGRVSAYLQSCVSKERALTKLLNNAPEEHLQLVDKMQKSLKITQKSNSNMLKEIARSEAMIIKNTAPGIMLEHLQQHQEHLQQDGRSTINRGISADGHH